MLQRTILKQTNLHQSDQTKTTPVNNTANTILHYDLQLIVPVVSNNLTNGMFACRHQRYES